MKKDSKKALYESIMASISKEVKKILNESFDEVSDNWIHLSQYDDELLTVYENEDEDEDEDYEDENMDTYIETLEKHAEIPGLYKMSIYCKSNVVNGPNVNVVDIPALPNLKAIIIDFGRKDVNRFMASGLFIDGEESREDISEYNFEDFDTIKNQYTGKLIKDTYNEDDIDFIKQMIHSGYTFDVDDSTEDLLIFTM